MGSRRTGGLVALLLVVGVAVAGWAQGWLHDVGPEHLQAGDIAYALDKGWFFGYEDGSFRPDQEITPEQMVAVLERFGRLTRADAATVLRAGHEALRDLESATTDTTLAPWYETDCKPVCVDSLGWGSDTSYGETRWWHNVRIVVGARCEFLGMTIYLIDGEGKRRGLSHMGLDNTAPGHSHLTDILPDGGEPFDVAAVEVEATCSTT